MSEQKISFWKKLFGKKGMPMEEPDASADLNEEVGQTAVAEAVKERKIRQKLQLPANMQSETAENVPDSFYEQMTKECQKLVEYGVSSYHYSEAERRYLTALSAYRGQDCFELPETVALPQVVDGKTIEAVESLAKTWGMKSVVIPKTVKEIEIGFIDGVEKICFEPGSCFRRFTPTGWSARGVLALEEVNFPTDADLLPLILLPGAKKIPYFVNIAFDEDGFKRCGECILDCNYAPEVYDSKEDTAVWLQWTDAAHDCKHIILRKKVREIYFPQGRSEHIGDFESEGNSLFGVEDGILYRYGERKRELLHVNRSRTGKTLVIDKKTRSIRPIVSDHIETVVIESRIKIPDGAFDLDTVRTVVLKNPDIKLHSSDFLHLEKGVTIYGDAGALNALKKGKKIIVRPLAEYWEENSRTENTSATFAAATPSEVGTPNQKQNKESDKKSNKNPDKTGKTLEMEGWVRPVVLDDGYPFGYEPVPEMISLINTARQGDKAAAGRLAEIYGDGTGGFYSEKKCTYWTGRMTGNET